MQPEHKKLKISKSNSMTTTFTALYHFEISKRAPESATINCGPDCIQRNIERVTRQCWVVPSSSFAQCTPVDHSTQTFRRDLYISQSSDSILVPRKPWAPEGNHGAPNADQLLSSLRIQCSIKSFLIMSKFLGYRNSCTMDDGPAERLHFEAESKTKFESRRRCFPRTVLDVTALQGDLDSWMKRELHLLHEATPSSAERQLRRGRLRILSESVERRRRIRVWRSESLEYRAKYVRVGKEVIEIVNEERKRRVELFNRLSEEPPKSSSVRIQLIEDTLEELKDEDGEIRGLVTLLEREGQILRSLGQRLSHMSGLRLRIRNCFLRYVLTCSCCRLSVGSFEYRV